MTALLAHQLRFDLLALRRNRRMQMFGLVLPVLLLVTFAGLFGDQPVEVAGHMVPADRASVPGIMGLAVLTSSFMALVMMVVSQRQTGILKRRRSTPCPAWVLVSSRALAATFSSIAACAVMLIVARSAYGLALASGGLVAALGLRPPSRRPPPALGAGHRVGDGRTRRRPRRMRVTLRGTSRCTLVGG